MAYCDYCGCELSSNAKYCQECGQAIRNPSTRSPQKEERAGKIIKCPSCGATLKSFIKSCPECGYELRGAPKTESVADFSSKYSQAKSFNEKIDLIRTFVIPNTKEDILEFAFLASSNIDASSSVKLLDAWMAKFEQAYHKASILLKGSQELAQVDALYSEKRMFLDSSKEQHKKDILQRKKKEKREAVLWTIIPLLIFFSFIALCVGLVIDSNNSDREADIQSQVKQIEDYITVGDYDKALTQAYAMNTYHKDSWINTRDTLISRIEELLGRIKIPSTDFVNKRYENVVACFKNAGFTNIKTEEVNDLILGFFHSEGDVKEVEIDGQTDYEEGAYVSSDVPIVIRYHSYSYSSTGTEQ